MSGWAKVGVKCVCISDFGGNNAPHIPVRGQVYTVVAVDHAHQFGTVIELAEFVNPKGCFRYEAKAFRPLTTRTQEQDVQMILSLLAPDEVPA